MEQSCWNSGTSDGGTVEPLKVKKCNIRLWKYVRVEHLRVEQWNILWWNSGTCDGGTVEYLMVEQYNILWSNSGTSVAGTVEDLMVEQWNI